MLTKSRQSQLGTSTNKYSVHTQWLAWDNFTLYPGLSGFRGGFNGYTIPTNSRVYPHGRGKSSTGLVEVLMWDGSVRFNEYSG